VEKVLFDRQAEAAVVVVAEEGGERTLPIWVGQAEAFSIALAAEQVELPRPITHDLLITLLETLGSSVRWVRVRDLKEGTYFATACIASERGTHEVDCRPSDAMAIALRARCPIYVAEEVFAAAASDDPNLPTTSDDLSEDYLASLPDEKFGKYKM
jgi:bifunctional DNase/RNase